MYDNVRVTGAFLPRVIGIWPCFTGSSIPLLFSLLFNLKELLIHLLFVQICVGEVLRPWPRQRSLLLQHGHLPVQDSLLDHQRLLSGCEPGDALVIPDQTWTEPLLKQLQVYLCY